MDFNLFNNKKDTKEIKEAQDIKDATNSQNSLNSVPSFETPIENTTQLQNNDFVNPFSKDQNNSPQEINLNEEIAKENVSSIQNNSAVHPINNTSNLNPTSEIKIENPIEEIKNSEDSFSKEDVVEIINETVEKVIEERWNQLVDKVNKVASWKEKQDAHLEMIKEDIVSMKEGVEKLEKRLINKVESYDKNILDVNSEIKALEKVFQKITPTLVNNVNELSKITQSFKNSKSENSIN